ncbi:MAG: alkaline phosphatase D family protein [bacterium]
MIRPSRRDVLRLAGLLGASLAWGSACSRSKGRFSPRIEHFPQGVASGDPDEHSVLLWTRRPPVDGSIARRLTLEIAEDDGFVRVVATAAAEIDAASDWTCRVLAAGLAPARTYWYRFLDDVGSGSRIGRTRTAPARDDVRPVRFAFVSCQNVCQGAQNAYRRMIFEDERRPDAEQLGFVLHLGDFIYEVTWYPEDRPQGMYARKLRDVVRFETGEKVRDFHVPVTVNDYRALYRAYLEDPDLQDARARWPFVCMWDNHEFSWRGWQSIMKFDEPRPGQTRKVAANQAWFEYQPARVVASGGDPRAQFTAPAVADVPVEHFDERGLGQEPNNLAAIRSLVIYRSLRWGKHLDLILTDNRSFAMESAMDRPEVKPFQAKEFPFLAPLDVIEAFDAGKAFPGGAPATIRFGGADLPNPRADHPPQTALGCEQKAWFLKQLETSTATWKIWGASFATLDARTDAANLPASFGARWPGAGYAALDGGDWSAYRTERAEIFERVRRSGITGFAIVSGDRHSFWAGLASPSLPPQPFEPVGVEFTCGSISAPGIVEAAEFRLPANLAMRDLYVHRRGPGARYEPTINMLLLHGVASCLEYVKTGDLERALALSNPDVAPHLSWLDLGGHGYAVVELTATTMETEFVCIPRPLERATGLDGGPLAYRVAHRVALWPAGQSPRLERTRLEGKPPLAT